MYEEGAGFGCGIRQRAVHAWPWLSQVSRAEELNGEPRPEARPDMLIGGPLGEIQLFQKKSNLFKIESIQNRSLRTRKISNKIML
jgi:hypothetical protein